MKAPVILGGLFLSVGLLIHLCFPFSSNHSSILGFNILDADDHHNQVKTAMWIGAAFALEVCGLLVLVFLRENSRPGKSV